MSSLKDKPENSEFYKVWEPILDKAAEFAHRHTVPFYTIQNDQVYLDRSGVLFKSAGHYFVLTAAHYLEEIIQNAVPFYFGWNDQSEMPIPLTGAGIHYTEHEAGKGTRDIAAMCLTPEHVNQLSGRYDYLTFPCIDTTDRKHVW